MQIERETTIVACLGGGRTEVRRIPRPMPGEGELVLRLSVCGLCGTDLFKLTEDIAEAGAVLGHEIVGEVLEVGPDASGRDGSPFEIGERIVVPHHVSCGECVLCRRGSETKCAVFCENLFRPGGFSEHVLVKERAVRLAARRVPETLPDIAAVFLEPSACVLRGMAHCGMTEDSTAVVVGAGSMGLLHLLVLKAEFPGCEVCVIDPLGERRNLALELGATAACEPSEAAIQVESITRGLGVDAVFDTVGGNRVLAANLRLTREGGSVVLFAHAPGDEDGFLDLNHLFKGERRLLGTYSGSLAEQDVIFDHLVERRLDPSPLVTARLPFSRFQEAVRRTREHRDLKILLEPDPPGSQAE